MISDSKRTNYKVQKVTTTLNSEDKVKYIKQNKPHLPISFNISELND